MGPSNNRSGARIRNTKSESKISKPTHWTYIRKLLPKLSRKLLRFTANYRPDNCKKGWDLNNIEYQSFSSSNYKKHKNFLKKHNIQICHKNTLPKFPDIAIQLNSFQLNERQIYLFGTIWLGNICPDRQRKIKSRRTTGRISDFFANHLFNISHNSELKIKLTPGHNLHIYTQGPPTPIPLRDELMIELALLHYYVLIITLPQSKYISPSFVHLKKLGKLRFLIDLRRIHFQFKYICLQMSSPMTEQISNWIQFLHTKLLGSILSSRLVHSTHRWLR